MEYTASAKKNNQDVVWVRAYKGDAMTFLAFDIHETLLKNFIGFSIHIRANKVGNRYKLYYYLLNKLTLKKEIRDKNNISDEEMSSSKFSPFQKFNWVHVPSTDHNISDPYFGEYIYAVTPRFLVNGILQPIDPELTAEVTADVSPFNLKGVKLGFARAFISSEAYLRRFGDNNQMRPNDNKLHFDITGNSGFVKMWDYDQEKMVDHAYTYEEQHKYLGWQARKRVMEFLDEVLTAPEIDNMSLEVFAYDLNEPVIGTKLEAIAKKGKLKIILDNSGKHGELGSYEDQFDKLFNKAPLKRDQILRGKFAALSHSKVMIQKKNGKAIKVLTGSANFSTNGLYVNANHVIVFDNPDVAALYSNVFKDSFGLSLMKKFNTTEWATQDKEFPSPQNPEMIIRFSPHKKAVAQKIFTAITNRIKDAKSDLLFAIMNDTSASSILDAVRDQVQNTDIFTYGITDTISNKNDSVMLYKPNSKRGVRIAARGAGVTNVLPKPFNTLPKIDGYAIHHKFVVVDFKGANPVVFCGSSNLAFSPEQKNGDNLIEIRDRDIVTAFAIEAFRLTEHFHWRNKTTTDPELTLNDNSGPVNAWYKKYFNPDDLRCMERKLFIRNSGL